MLQLLLHAVSHHAGIRTEKPLDALSLQLVNAVAHGEMVFSTSCYIPLARAIWEECCGGEVKITMPLTEEQQSIIKTITMFFSSLTNQMCEALAEEEKA